MKVQTISVKELRNNFPRIRKDLERGISYTLIYRSKPLAEIKPIEHKKKNYKNLLKPPKSLFFRSKISAVELVRKERD
ncbi:MAG: hypothetical protein M1365_17215 [Actinobacteria bacterium]|nr:hypothetical protein [Actinomycetota bacterium]